jgi:serine protease Do
MKVWLASASAVLSSLAWTARAGALELQELAAQAKPSVVLLTVHDRLGRPVSEGTGFFVSSDGRVVTNHHVVEGAEGVTAKLADGREIDVVGVLADDPLKDVAIVQAKIDGVRPLALGNSGALRPGDEIVVIGSPLGLSGTLSTGIVSAVRDEGLNDQRRTGDPSVDAWRIQITAPVSHGSSGSPILTRGGDVVAVAVGMLSSGQNLNFGVPIEVAKSMLAGIGDHPKATPFAHEAKSDIWLNLAWSAGIFAAGAGVYVLWRRFDERRRRRPRPES